MRGSGIFIGFVIALVLVSIACLLAGGEAGPAGAIGSGLAVLFGVGASGYIGKKPTGSASNGASGPDLGEAGRTIESVSGAIKDAGSEIGDVATGLDGGDRELPRPGSRLRARATSIIDHEQDTSRD